MAARSRPAGAGRSTTGSGPPRPATPGWSRSKDAGTPRDRSAPARSLPRLLPAGASSARGRIDERALIAGEERPPRALAHRLAAAQVLVARRVQQRHQRRVLAVVVVAGDREQDVPASQRSAGHLARLDAGHRYGHAVAEPDGGEGPRRRSR